MRLRLRIAVVSGGVLLAVTGAARADEHVYRYRTPDGREVFTNAGRVQVGGEVLTPLALPELTSIDFSGASPSQLRVLDSGVQRAHETLQTGERCEAIRASSRVSLRAFLFREHLRELLVAGMLAASALVVLSAWSGRLRGLMPIPPLLGCLFLGYSAYTRVDHRLAALREGLRACSAELPEAHDAAPEAVKQRLESALSVQAMVDRAYAERAQQVDQLLRER